MSRKKVDENHKITEPDFVEEPAESSTDDTTVYAEDMSPPAEEKVSQEKSVAGNPDGKVTLCLAKGATFTSGGKIYSKGVLEPVPPDIADKLMKTGFFERA